jgi:hypothetical protein
VARRLVFLIVIFCVVWTPFADTTATVTSSSDSGPGTLREALASGAASIRIQTTEPIILLTQLPNLSNISIYGDISSTISYKGSVPLLNVLGATTLSNLCFSNCVVTNFCLISNVSSLALLDCRVASNLCLYPPSGVISSSGSLMISNCSFVGNRLEGRGATNFNADREGVLAMGGAIYQQGGSCSIFQSDFIGNFVHGGPFGVFSDFGKRLTTAPGPAFGGALYATSSIVSISESRFIGNYARGGPGESVNGGALPGSGWGGGTFFVGVAATVRNTLFSLNSAQGDTQFRALGGGIMNLLSSTELSGCTFEQNFCSETLSSNGGNYPSLGGGLATWLQPAAISNCVFRRNSASEGSDVSGPIISHGHNTFEDPRATGPFDPTDDFPDRDFFSVSPTIRAIADAPFVVYDFFNFNGKAYAFGTDKTNTYCAEIAPSGSLGPTQKIRDGGFSFFAASEPSPGQLSISLYRLNFDSTGKSNLVSMTWNGLGPFVETSSWIDGRELDRTSKSTYVIARKTTSDFQDLYKDGVSLLHGIRAAFVGGMVDPDDNWFVINESVSFTFPGTSQIIPTNALFKISSSNTLVWVQSYPAYVYPLKAVRGAIFLYTYVSGQTYIFKLNDSGQIVAKSPELSTGVSLSFYYDSSREALYVQSVAPIDVFPLRSAFSGSSDFIYALSPDFSLRWATRILNTSYPTGLATDPHGNVLFANGVQPFTPLGPYVTGTTSARFAAFSNVVHPTEGPLVATIVPPQTLTSRLAASGVEFSWFTEPEFQLQKTTSLTAPDWQQVAPSEVSSNKTYFRPLTGDSKGFFRLIGN